MVEDYYSLLGVAPDASAEAILEAYRRQAAEHHPDVSDDPDAGETFRQLNRAKAVLTDDARRRAYDQLGHERFEERDDSGEGDPGDRTSADRRGGAGGRWPAGVGTLLDHLLGGGFDRRTGRAAARVSAKNARRAGTGDPFEVDLSSLLRGGPAPRSDRRAKGTHGRGERECPKCGGRGTFVHVLDTGRGRRRRLEACERCGGGGTVPA